MTRTQHRQGRKERSPLHIIPVRREANSTHRASRPLSLSRLVGSLLLVAGGRERPFILLQGFCIDRSVYRVGFSIASITGHSGMPPLRIRPLVRPRIRTKPPEHDGHTSRSPTPPQSARSEYVLRSVGLLLAVASTAFAAHMIGNADRKPEFAGIEHLAIFSRPSIMASRRVKGDRRLSASRDHGIDYAPVGALSAGDEAFGASSFYVLEASPQSALIRGPRGEILRVMKGDILAGVGRIDAIVRRRGRWTVLTADGVIVERPPGSGKN